MITTEEPTIGQAPTDVKEAADEDLRCWSVTTIIDVLAKPALLHWSAEMAATAAVSQRTTWSSMEQESGTEEAVRWLTNARFRAPKNELSGADFGTALHKLCEQYALTGKRPEITAATFKADLEKAQACFERFDEWLQQFQPSYQATEVTVYSPSFGYAGTCDGFFTIDGVRLILDYKSSKKSYYKKGDPTHPWPEVALQLAAYRYAEIAAVWRARRFEHFRRRYYLLAQAERDQAAPVPEVDGGVCIHIAPEHCVAYPVRCDEQVYEAFLYCLEVARYQFEMAKRVIGDALTFPEPTS